MAFLMMSNRYQHLDGQKKRVQDAKEKSNGDPGKTSFEASLKARMAAFGGEDALPWIYRNDIEDVWQKYLGEHGQSVSNGHQE
jgi:salicylate hydroxylase